jgi:predicted nucleotidyltransferase
MRYTAAMDAPEQTVDRIVRRIVEAVHPLRIILFGSRARGDARPDSDLDLLVVMPEGTHRR